MEVEVGWSRGGQQELPSIRQQLVNLLRMKDYLRIRYDAVLHPLYSVYGVPDLSGKEIGNTGKLANNDFMFVNNNKLRSPSSVRTGAT